MAEILETIDWSPLFISLKTGILATVLAFFAGIAAARFIMKLNNTAKAVVDGLLTLPLVLPPTVAGFFLLLIFSLRRPFGKYLYTQLILKWFRPGRAVLSQHLSLHFHLCIEMQEQHLNRLT